MPGRSIPVFNVTGNHGFTNGDVQVVNWPEDNAAATSSGKYQMEPYPSINGSDPGSYPSMWYAFDAGPARFYVLTAAWADGNIGHGSVYENDHDAHWTTNSAEYQWLKNDLAAHPTSLKFAFWHYPLYADSGQGVGHLPAGWHRHAAGSAQRVRASTSLQRPRPRLRAQQGRRRRHGVLRLRQRRRGRSARSAGASPIDLYAIGANGTHCGAAPSGLSDDHVYGFAKVTVDGRKVTVTPTDELGRTYDIQTYNFPAPK